MVMENTLVSALYSNSENIIAIVKFDYHKFMLNRKGSHCSSLKFG